MRLLSLGNAGEGVKVESSWKRVSARGESGCRSTIILNGQGLSKLSAIPQSVRTTPIIVCGRNGR